MRNRERVLAGFEETEGFFGHTTGRIRERIILMTNDRNRRVLREQKTVEVMVAIYCHGRHGTRDDLCPECSELREYARRSLERCPFREKKPTCANCRIHCYKPDMREKITQAMRYAGPRMIYRSPVLAFFHFLDGFRKPQDKKNSVR